MVVAALESFHNPKPTQHLSNAPDQGLLATALISPPPPPPLLPQITQESASLASMNGSTPMSPSVEVGYGPIYWICGQCTYTNNANLNRNKCDLCGGTRETMTLGGCDNNNYMYDTPSDEAIFDIMLHDLPVEPTYQHFESVLNIIIAQAPGPRPAITVLKSLKKITSRVSDQKPKYRSLDTRTEGVQTKLLGFEGSLEYLQLLGYTFDASQTKLQCLKHPSQQLLDEIRALIDELLLTQREEVRKMKRSKRSEISNFEPSLVMPEESIEKDAQMEQKVLEEEDEYEEEHVELKLDSGDFTLSQLVGLVTHETFYDENAMKVLLLCHRCFSSSLELIEAIRKRFFVPAPVEAATWSEHEIIVWCQTIQRPIQNQCVQILVEWITNYFYVDFYLQPIVLSDLQKFCEQVLECKYESDDGWYDSLSTYLLSAIENGQQKIRGNKLLNSEKEEDKKDESDVMDMNEMMQLVTINYGHEVKKQRRSKLFGKAPVSKTAEIRILFYQYPAKNIAQQLSLKDFKYFSHIHAREFLDKVWKGKGDKYCMDLQKMIDRFNAIHKYIKLSIIIPHKLSDRVLVLQHMIDIGKHLLDLRNCFSLMAVFSALDSIPINKLKYMWLRLGEKYKGLLKQLATVCDAKSNYQSQRKLMRKSFDLGMPVIPYIGVFLSDLTFVNQGAAKLVEGFVNFKRFERFNERCKIVESFQKKGYKHQLSQLSLIMENDIEILNDKMDDTCFKTLLANSIQLDEKNATNSEKQMMKKMQSKKKRKPRAKFKKA